MTVLEKEDGPARHQTGRNSGVIHSGIYYRPGSLKARFAVRGAAEMVKFCAEYGIAHAVTGKLIVATERAELPRLHALVQRGRENGIPVRELGADRRVRTSGARPGRDTRRHHRRVRLRGRRPGAGPRLRGGDPLRRAGRPGGPAAGAGVAVLTAAGEVVRGRVLVNCAGLRCDEVARLTGDEPGMRIVPFRGEYYELARPELVRGLVYPVPDPAFPFLGVHLTRGVDGGVHIGPNAVPALAREGYGWGSYDPVSWPGPWPGPAPGRSPGGTGGTGRVSCAARCPRGVPGGGAQTAARCAGRGPGAPRPGCGRRRCCGTGRWWTTS
ncbi:FAD-dependent oxidoreductase [Streptomyces nogalater]